MTERLLDTADVLDKVGFSRAWLDERVAEGTFPQPVHKWRRNKWREKVVDDWILTNFGGAQEGQPKPEAARASH